MIIWLFLTSNYYKYYKMSFLSKLFCCCRINNPLDNCSDSTMMWNSDLREKTKNNSKNTEVFSKPEIRFYGLFDEALKNMPFDVHLFSKSEIKKISIGQSHTVFLFSKLYI